MSGSGEDYGDVDSKYILEIDGETIAVDIGEPLEPVERPVADKEIAIKNKKSERRAFLAKVFTSISLTILIIYLGYSFIIHIHW